MRKINIKDIKVTVDLANLININTPSKVLIDLLGNVYVNEQMTKNIPIIALMDNFKNVYLDLNTMVNQNLADYKAEILGTNCKLSPVGNWQKIIDYNKNQFLYFDHQSDGVEIFEDSIMEDIGWHASPLEISYREISEFIEENCDGTLVFYDNGVQFNGFAIVDNIEDVRAKTKEFVVQKAKQNIEDGIVDVDDDDVIESMEFFGIKA